MRISDWSSDVCSSDLQHHPPCAARRRQIRCGRRTLADHEQGRRGGEARRCHRRVFLPAIAGAAARCEVQREIQQDERSPRSEEHTSELQSLMRISYAVFCLKKKTHSNSFPIYTT